MHTEDDQRRPAITSSAFTLRPGARILVTGGAGFIGSHLVDHLLARGCQVAIVDDLSSGDRANLASKAVFHQASITDMAALRAVFQDFKPEAVVHTAAQVKIVKSMEDPAWDLRVNVEGTRNVLDLSQGASVRRFIFISTGGAMYGETTEAATEATLPQPFSYYAVHKYTGERYVEMRGLSYAILRLANVYGPRQRADLEGGVVPIFLDRLRERQPVTIFGTGEQARDFVHVDDVAQAVLLAMESAQSGLWNVSVGEPITVNQLLETLSRLYQAPVEVRHAPARPGEIFRGWLSYAKIERDLGWRPHFSLEAGLLDLIKKTTRPGQATTGKS